MVNSEQKAKQHQLMEYVNSREAMLILSIKSPTTLILREKEGKLNPTRIFGTNRKRYKVTELNKILKGY